MLLVIKLLKFKNYLGQIDSTSGKLTHAKYVWVSTFDPCHHTSHFQNQWSNPGFLQAPSGLSIKPADLYCHAIPILKNPEFDLKKNPHAT